MFSIQYFNLRILVGKQCRFKFLNLFPTLLTHFHRGPKVHLLLEEMIEIGFSEKHYFFIRIPKNLGNLFPNQLYFSFLSIHI